MRADGSTTRGARVTSGGAIKRALVFVALCVGAAIFSVPFLWTVSTALKTNQQVFAVPPQWIPNPPQWGNFRRAWTELPFATFVLNTVTITAIAVVGQVATASLVAYGFARFRFRGRNFLFYLMLSTMMLPAQVTMIPLYIVFRQLGWVGTIWPLVVPAFFGNALYVFLLRQFMMTIPNELSDAARIDGAGELGIFWRIIVPLIKPALATVALFTFVATYRDFLGPLIYLTEQNQWTISLGLKMFQNMYGAQWQLMMAAATLTMIPTVILFFLTQRTFIEEIALT